MNLEGKFNTFSSKLFNQSRQSELEMKKKSKLEEKLKRKEEKESIYSILCFLI
jgi:hypothetical protein